MKTLLFLLLVPFLAFGQVQLSPQNHTVVSSGPLEGYDRSRIVTTANSNPLVIWSKLSSPKSIRARKWNGTTFGNAVDIVGSDLMPTGFIGPEIAAKGDTVYLIFESLIHANHVIYLKKSFDGGMTFSDTIRVSENSNTHKFAMPNVAVRSDGNPLISYMECLPNWTHWKQTVRTSFDFGTTFSAAVDVSSLAPGEPCDCCQSTMVTNGNDDVLLLFRNNDNNVRNSYIAKSNDGGITFTSAQDLDDMNWVFNSCPTSSPVGAVNNDSIMIIRRNGGSGVNKLYKSNVNMNDLQKSYFTELDASNAPLQDKAEIASFKNSPNWSVVVWEENRNGVKECFYSIIDDNGAYLNAGVVSDISIFGHKIEPDITYVGGDTFAITYTASTQYEVHFVFVELSDVVSINVLNSPNRKVVKTIDLLARDVNPDINKPFINIYNDGRIERKLIIE